MRRLTLEERINRLEKLLSGRKSVRNEAVTGTMTVKELIEKLSKLDPDIECFTVDSNSHWCKIIDAWNESDEEKEYAYIELQSLGPAELWG